MKTIGILGGMGPAATLALAQRIIDQTPATSDQEHIPMLIHNNTNIPDRTLAIKGDGQSAFPELVRSLNILEREADFIVMPCNTAHFYFSELRKIATKPILHMVEETVKMIRCSYNDVHTIGLLATDGTILSRVYHDLFEEHGLKLIVPDAFDQEHLVMMSIYGPDGIKAGKSDLAQKKLELAGEKLIQAGAQVVIGGCTEIPLLLKQESVSYVIIDPAKVLAKRSVELALEKEETEVKIQSHQEVYS